MGEREASPRGSKPAWIASAAAMAIVGLAITVALPVGSSAMRSARLSPVAAELQGASLHLAASKATPEAGAIPEGATVETHRGTAVPVEEGTALPIETTPSEAEQQDSTETHGLSDQQVHETLALMRREFEKLRKADPRSALLLLEELQLGLAEDPDVVLLKAERAAIATLRNLCSAQAQLQASCAIDVDSDGAGEYGTFAELSGGCNLRGTETHLEPPVLSAAFRSVQRGIVERSGYCFGIFLPDATGQGLAEAYEGGAHMALFQAVAADRCETTWCAYAWPTSAQMPGRVFFVNQQGDVVARENGSAGELLYSGADAPSADAAFEATSMPGAITGGVAHSSAAHDGGRWMVVQ